MIAAIHRWFTHHTMVGDLLLALVLSPVIVGSASGAASAVPGGWKLVWGLAYLAPLVIRRTHPEIAGLLLIPPHVAQLAFLDSMTGANITVPIIIEAIAARTPARRAGLWLAFGGLCSAAAGLDWAVRPVRAQEVIAGAAMVFVVVAAAWFMGRLAAERLRTVRVLNERAEGRDRERDQELRLAAQEERVRIAREMHDVVAHALSVIVVQADGAAYLARQRAGQASPGTPVPETPGPETPVLETPVLETPVLETIADTARAALGETRRLVGVLRDGEAIPDWSPQATLAMIPALVARTNDAGLPVHLTETGDPSAHPAPSGSVERAGYRIVQESLTNVLKHAGPGATADVTIEHTPEGLRISIRDTGRGLAGPVDGDDATVDGTGHGLVGMRERVAAHGGTFVARPRLDAGFEVIATLPTNTLPTDTEENRA